MGCWSKVLQFKIDQAGLLSGTVGNGTWGSGKMIADNSSWTTTIPSSVPGGQYLIRFETIALHSLPAVSHLLKLIDDGQKANITVQSNSTLSVHRFKLQMVAAESPLQQNWLRSLGAILIATLAVSSPKLYFGSGNLTWYTYDLQWLSTSIHKRPRLSRYQIPMNEMWFWDKIRTTYIIPGPPLYGSNGSVSSSPCKVGPSLIFDRKILPVRLQHRTLQLQLLQPRLLPPLLLRRELYHNMDNVVELVGQVVLAVFLPTNVPNSMVRCLISFFDRLSDNYKDYYYQCL